MAVTARGRARRTGGGLRSGGAVRMGDAHRNAITSAVHGGVVQARDVGTIVLAPRAYPGAARAPHQLPGLGGRVWVNRADELARLDELVSLPAPARVVVTGMGGVGKTAMAVRWLARRQAAYPDGELYVDLGGWSGRPPPVPEQVLGAWLRALGVPADDMPQELAELAALYRTVLADRSLFILADNAYRAEQVRPLLPGTSSSLILVTSRRRLPELSMDGFTHLVLHCLSAEDSASLLAGLLPEHQPAQAPALAALADRCRGLPLAVSIAAGHLNVHRQYTPTGLLARWDAGPLRKLDLRLGGRSVAAVLDMSYADLDADHARLYRLCALHPGLEFTAGPLAAAWARTESDTDDGLGLLVDANLVMVVGEGRYRLHDLVREHATARAEQGPEGDRAAAVRVMITWYLRRTAEAARALNRWAVRFAPVFDLVGATTFARPAAAMAWFQTDRATILGCQQLAADYGWDELVYQFADTVWDLVRPDYAAEDLLRTQQLGAQAARRAGHVLDGVCLVRVAFAHTNRGRHEAAIAAAMAAFECGSVRDHRWTQAAALSVRARALLAHDDPRAAIADTHRSMTFAAALPDPDRDIALRERRLGQAYAHPTIADYPQAVHHFRRAATLMRGVGDQIGYARVVIDMAPALLHTDQAPVALAELEQLVDTVRGYGSTGYTADLYAALGRVLDHLGRTDDARRYYTDAITLYEVAGRGASGQRDSLAALRDALPPATPPSPPPAQK